MVRTGQGKGGILRLDFAEKDENFDEIDWDKFFEVFEASQLAFLHQDKTADGKVSRFNKFVDRSENDDTPPRKAAVAKGKATTKAPKAASAKKPASKSATGKAAARAASPKAGPKAAAAKKATAAKKTTAAKAGT